MTRKKIFNKNILIIALCAFLGVLGAFRSVSAPRAFADTEEIYIDLTQSGIVNYWVTVYRGQTSSLSNWSAFQQSSDNGLIAQRKVNGYNIQHYYSSVTGEKVCILQHTLIDITDYINYNVLYEDIVACVISIKNTVSNNTIYIINIFDAGQKTIIEFSNYTVDGQKFPNPNDNDFGKFELRSIQLLTIDNLDNPTIETETGYSAGIFQPIFHINSSNYYGLFTNATISDYNLNNNSILKFTDFFAQFTDLDAVAVSTGTGVPVQNDHSLNINDYKIEYQAKTADGNAFINSASSNGAQLYISSGTSTLQIKQDSIFTTLTSTAGYSWTPLRDSDNDYMSIATTADGDAINLKTTSNALTTVLKNFHIMLKAGQIAYTPVTPPTDDGDESEPLPDGVIFRIGDFDVPWWLAAIGFAASPTLQILVPAVFKGIDLTLSWKNFLFGDASLGQIGIVGIAQFFFQLIKNIVTSIATVIRDIINWASTAPPAETFLLILAIIAGIFGTLWIFLGIKKKKE